MAKRKEHLLIFGLGVDNEVEKPADPYVALWTLRDKALDVLARKEAETDRHIWDRVPVPPRPLQRRMVVQDVAQSKAHASTPQLTGKESTVVVMAVAASS